ncbi:MAG TPA: hypothetical protein VF903_02285 [Nitrospirota bacterium]
MKTRIREYRGRVFRPAFAAYPSRSKKETAGKVTGRRLLRRRRFRIHADMNDEKERLFTGGFCLKSIFTSLRRSPGDCSWPGDVWNRATGRAKKNGKNRHKTIIFLTNFNAC